MSKQFIKVTKTYSTKNKLQLAILKRLEEADASLFRKRSYAQAFVRHLYEEGVRSYKGNAVVPELRTHEPDENQVVYYVDDVIFLSIYTVKTDLS